MTHIVESLGTIDEVFGKASPTSLPLITAAHEFLINLDPDAVIVPRLGEKSIAYGIGVKKMSEAYCYLIPFNDYVNFGFYHGTSIDSDGILEGTGAKIRHIKIRNVNDLDNPRLKELVLKAIQGRKSNA
jgi:hypothetical protein